MSNFNQWLLGIGMATYCIGSHQEPWARLGLLIVYISIIRSQKKEQ